MRKLFLLFLLFSLSFQTVFVQGQSQQIKFTRINSLEDLTIGQVNFIAQDKYGFIWLSEESYGSLTRFDGQNLKRYQNIQGETNSLGGSYPECLFIDQDGIIWIGFVGQGMDRFDPFTETFTHFRHDPNDPGSLSNDNVASILRDHLGTLWIATYGGLCQLNEESGDFIHFQHQPDDSTSISSNITRELYEDQQGTLWIGTGWFGGDPGGLNRFERNTGTFTRYMADIDDPTSLINSRVTSMLEDSHGNFWIGTGGDGLHTLDRKTGQFTRYRYDPRNPEKLSAPGPSEGEFGITFIAEDLQQNLWIGTVSRGTNMYDFRTKKIKHFGNNTDAFGTFIENGSWCMYLEQNGLIWLSTQPGLYLIDPYYIEIPKIDEALPTFYRQSDSVIWYGSKEGLVRENLSNGIKNSWKINDGDPNSVISADITEIFMDSQETLWIGTEGSGLNKYDPENNRFIRFRHDSRDSTSIGNDNITAIIQDNSGSLLVGTYEGLDKMDVTTGVFFHNDFFGEGMLGDITSVSSLMLGEENELWIGLSSGGSLVKLNTNEKKVRLYSLGNGINDIYKDKDGIIWVASPSGLYSYDKEVDHFSPRSNHPMISIFEDKEENLWVNSISQILKISKDRDYVLEYQCEYIDRQGFMNTVTADGYRGRDGRIYLGDQAGYYVFDPDGILIPPDTSKLYFTNFWIGEKLVKPDENGPLKQSLFKADAIYLDYDQNTFSLDFTEIDFRNRRENKIRYFLENYDLDWREASAGERIIYSKVPSGEYIFRIKAPNSGTGAWAENSISIKVLPPWWLTWWAYIIYGFICIAIVIYVNRMQRKRLLKIAMAEAKEKELEHARVIEKAYNDLKATQAQLIQSEKMASLGELTAGIAHEIQNPLNFVNNFSEINSELIEELREEMKKGNMKEADDIAKDVIENENKIKHHGKRAEGIVKGMLQHSRASSNEKEPTDINRLVDEYLRLAYHGLRAKDKSFNAELKTKFDKSLPKIDVISQDIARVLLNLINNAFYAVHEKAQTGLNGFTPQVIVSTVKVGDKIEIKVADNGPGIPEQVRDKIFQPFFTTKPTGSGTGLGLSLSYDIVKAHGGEIKVENGTEKGATFIIRLPNK